MVKKACKIQLKIKMLDKRIREIEKALRILAIAKMCGFLLLMLSDKPFSIGIKDSRFGHKSYI